MYNVTMVLAVSDIIMLVVCVCHDHSAKSANQGRKEGRREKRRKKGGKKEGKKEEGLGREERRRGGRC